MFRLLQIVRLGLKSLMLHKLRSALTALGIVFGVCSVIAMLSIGEGASQEAQETIRLLGTNNIIVRSVKPPEETAANTARSSVNQYGLTYRDMGLIAETIPSVEMVAPMRDLRGDVRYLSKRFDARIIGTVPDYPRLIGWPLAAGRFISAVDEKFAANVCVLCGKVARELFGYLEPLGKDVKIGGDYYRVVGLMAPRGGAEGGSVEADLDRDVYIPFNAARKRFGEVTVKVRSGSYEFEKVEVHQANVHVRDVEEVLSAAQAVKAILMKTHKKSDYEMTVPLELLRQAEHTKRIFNIVLGSIAGISLLVGGIGIMNIMLATITERTREIGIRRALGAKKRDITLQFLVETIVLSGFGGILGIGLGIMIPDLVTRFSDMQTVVTVHSLVLAFGVSGATGVLFGLYPAWRAANMDPIEALRHE